MTGPPPARVTTMASEGAGFLVLSFFVVLGLWLLDPKDR